MLEILYEAERLLPKLLETEDGWTGLFADTEKPALTRVWRQWGERRINLHSFGPCSHGQVFAHPHPWQSAVRTWGDYEMGIGQSDDPAGPLFFERMVLKPGSVYAITNAKSWHWVRPAGAGSDSVMVSGPPIYPQNRIHANTPVRSLTRAEILGMLEYFKRYYPH